MLFRLLVALSAFLLEDKLHLSLCVLDHGCLHLDMAGWNDGVAAQGVFTGAEFEYLVKSKGVSDLDVAETRHGEDVTGSQDIFATDEICDDVLGRLGADELERVASRGGHSDCMGSPTCGFYESLA